MKTIGLCLRYVSCVFLLILFSILGCSGDGQVGKPAFLHSLKQGRCPLSSQECTTQGARLVGLIPTHERILDSQNAGCGCVFFSEAFDPSQMKPTNGECPNACVVAEAELWGVCQIDEVTQKLTACSCECLLLSEPLLVCPGESSSACQSSIPSVRAVTEESSSPQ